jgi:hypothetical protein
VVNSIGILDIGLLFFVGAWTTWFCYHRFLQHKLDNWFLTGFLSFYAIIAFEGISIRYWFFSSSVGYLNFKK